MNNQIVKNVLKFAPAVIGGVITLATNIVDVKKADEYAELIKRVAELENKIK